jgi:hypothetical protein
LSTPEPYGRYEHFAWHMLEGSGFTSLRQKARFARIVCVVGIQLGETAVAVAEIPLPRPRPADVSSDLTSTNPETSLCQQQLGGFAEFKALQPITGPGECLANDVVALDSVSLADKHRIVLSPPAILRCPMAKAIALWLRDDVAPVIAGLGTSLRGVETLDSFVCRGRNGASGGKISEHGRANALDVRALKLADGRTIGLTDERVAKSLRDNLRQSACRRFTTVLGNGADAYHESHVHLDLLERSNHYRICQWDVLDVAESAALVAKKAAQAANTVPERDVPLPRPRPAVKGDASSSLARHRRERSREAGRNAIFDLIRPLTRFVH